jgi:uncharacterized membrane protein
MPIIIIISIIIVIIIIILIIVIVRRNVPMHDTLFRNENVRGDRAGSRFVRSSSRRAEGDERGRRIRSQRRPASNCH